MLNIKFNYKGIETIIQCNIYENIKEIINKFKIKADINNEVYYLYNGTKINEELKIEEIINNEDRKMNIMNILVNDIIEEENKNIIESKEMICPKCKENIIINIKDYKFEMKCKNKHYYYLFLNEYNNKIDISKIICNKCNNNY